MSQIFCWLLKSHKPFSWVKGSERDVVYLSWPIAPSYMSPNAGGGEDPANEYSCVVCTWSPKKLWRSNSIFNLCLEYRTERKLAKYWWSYIRSIPWTRGWRGQECWRRTLPPPPRLGWIRSAALCLTPTPRCPMTSQKVYCISAVLFRFLFVTSFHDLQKQMCWGCWYFWFSEIISLIQPYSDDYR